MRAVHITSAQTRDKNAGRYFGWTSAEHTASGGEYKPKGGWAGFLNTNTLVKT